VSLYHDWFVNLSIGETASFTLVLTFGAKDFLIVRLPLNDRCEVSKRADQAERRRITVAKEAAGGSEQQGVLDGNQATSYLESAEHCYSTERV
jgi:hypothetical protein